ncbi:UNVERIFIED_CONTAM: putative mitochondrial protein [Sesamum calycinum]|uniref:Mitochondrial protein n=1 Tax=Sesamum calycinum TaxID=2727403 RepID=A0AAW2QJU8_9LAMI
MGGFFVAKFLSGLDSNLKVVYDHLLANDSIPTLSGALSHVLRVATGTSESSSSSGTPTESSAMDLQIRRTIGGGHEHGGLYFLDTSPPVDVYSRRNRSTTTKLTAPLGLPPTAAPGNLSTTSANDLPIALHKGMVVLAVYVDDILIIGSDIVGIEETKTYLKKHFVTKDLGRPRYFLGIEIAHSKHGVSLSQRKYAYDILQEAGLLGTKPMDTPMDSNPNFWKDDGNYLEDKTKFMDKPQSVHWGAGLRMLKYIKASSDKGLLFKRHEHVKIKAYSDADYVGSKDDRKSTSGYCTYVGGNL